MTTERATKPPLTALQRWIIERRYTLDTAANVFDLSAAYLCRVASGKRRPSDALARTIQGHTGLSIDEILAPSGAYAADVRARASISQPNAFAGARPTTCPRSASGAPVDDSSASVAQSSNNPPGGGGPPQKGGA